MTVMALAVIESSIVNTSLPRIVTDLGGMARMAWAVTAFLLASTIAAPLYGKLSDLYGRRSLLIVSIGIFLLGSMLSGAAQSMTQLIGFRAVQGPRRRRPDHAGSGIDRRSGRPCTARALPDLFHYRLRAE